MKKLSIAAICLSALMLVVSCEKTAEPGQEKEQQPIDDDPEVIQPTEKEKNMVTEPMAWRLDSLTISVERTAKVVLLLPILSLRLPILSMCLQHRHFFCNFASLF